MKAIVTGANGFLGTALCKELVSREIDVVAVVKDQSENIEPIKNQAGLQIVYCDLANFKNLPKIIADRDFDVFYHLAWIGSAGNLRSDEKVQLDNVRYTCDIVRVCKELGCKRFVFAGSIMEYEISYLMNTDKVPSISSLYSIAKISADYMARTIANKLNVDYIRAVISNIYGPGELSPRFINTSLRKLLNGEHCSFSAGEQMYDFIYIDDAAKCFAEIGGKGKNNKTYYVGSLKPQKLKFFLQDMLQTVAPDASVGFGEIAFGGVSLNYSEFDIKAVYCDTGFVPEVSFTEGIRRTFKWLKENEQNV